MDLNVTGSSNFLSGAEFQFLKLISSENTNHAIGGSLKLHKPNISEDTSNQEEPKLCWYKILF